MKPLLLHLVTSVCLHLLTGVGPAPRVQAGYTLPEDVHTSNTRVPELWQQISPVCFQEIHLTLEQQGGDVNAFPSPGPR